MRFRVVAERTWNTRTHPCKLGVVNLKITCRDSSSSKRRIKFNALFEDDASWQGQWHKG